MRFFRFSWLLLPFVFACAPNVSVKNFQQFQATKNYEPFVVFNLNDSIAIAEQQIIGNIEIKDGGFTLDCSLETITNLAQNRARAMGANALKIYWYRAPNSFSSCHAIKAKALRMNDVRRFEKQIEWHPNRKLEIADFKGSTADRPFLAATASGFSYSWAGRLVDGYVTLDARTLFDCHLSYFKTDSDSVLTLRHEQLHFDIAEIYARKFLQKLEAANLTLKNLETNGRKIADEIKIEMSEYQDRYDSEVYPFPEKQVEWDMKVQIELMNLKKYESKTLKIKTK